MQKLKYLLLVLVSVFSTLMFISGTSQAKTFSVGFLFNEFHTDRWQHDRFIFSHLMKAESVDFYSVSARGSADLQVAQINQMINDGVDALVIVPVDQSKLKAVLKRAKKHHVIVLAYDKMINSGYISAYVGVDSKYTIKTQVMEMLNITKEGNYILILDGKNNIFYKSLKESFAFYKKQHKKKYNVNTYVLDTTNIHGVLDKLLEKLKYKVSGILVYDDDVANDVISILHKNNIYSVYVTGMNATKKGIVNILNGYQYSTIYRNITNESTIAGKTVLALLKHKKIPKELNMVLSNPYTTKIPAHKKPPRYITKTNAKTLMTTNVFSKRILKMMNQEIKNKGG